MIYRIALHGRASASASASVSASLCAQIDTGNDRDMWLFLASPSKFFFGSSCSRSVDDLF